MESNKFQSVKNPYLEMHKNQPIHWFPWCEEAFMKAKDENKPVFLSIGYSTCHWCHVMAKESFEDNEIATLLNDGFISIKVDREEHPEVDAVYMNFCQVLTGNGGWPLSVFLTPDKKPFFAGTYFPKHARNNHIGFMELLELIHNKWQKEHHILEREADYIVKEVSASLVTKKKANKIVDHLTKGDKYLLSEFDEKYGGFGTSPKFPTPHRLFFLADRYQTNPSPEILSVMEFTALQMAKGGIFDHIGGGFCRYSTDRFFLVPHFEKMLYDNALLISFYAKLYEITKKKLYFSVAEMTSRFLVEGMKSSDGGFYTAQDADSDGEEGLYYLFTQEEINSVLGNEVGRAFSGRYRITRKGNFYGKSIPNLLDREVDEQDFNWDDPIKKDLRVFRDQRMALFTDKKILTSWNAMVISAFVDLYRVSGKKEYLSIALETYHFLHNTIYRNGYLLRGVQFGEGMADGTLDDYAWYIYALLHLHQAILDPLFLDESLKCCVKAVELFWDETSFGFYQNSKNKQDMILKIKETYDGAIPSGNSMMAENLRILSVLTDDETINNLREKQYDFMMSQIGDRPEYSFFFLYAKNRVDNVPSKIIYVPCEENRIEEHIYGVSTRDLIKMIAPSEEYPLKNEKDTFYICDAFSCKPPVNSI